MAVITHDYTGLKPFVQHKGKLSEGITFNPSNNTLLWVDIIRGQLHRSFLEGDLLTRSSKSHEVHSFPNETIGVIYLTEDDDLVVLGGQFGLAEFRFSTKSFDYKLKFDTNSVVTPEGLDKYRLRSNDGNVDPNGNIWQGLMGNCNIGPVPEGRLVKFSPNGTTKEQDSLIPNGINWSKDGKTLYWTSSLEFTIYKFDFDLETSTVSNKTPFINFKNVFPELESPEPDGFILTTDEEIITAVWSSSSVVHFNKQGEVIQVFKLPTPRISCVNFGATNELFITSANLNLDNDDNNSDPNDFSGSIFRIVLENGEFNGVPRPILTKAQLEKLYAGNK
ncbi:hypothetical protein WICPIJ_008031 [Wickerhamomyces pijperi]|uniref:SMP-30/Gluconolactonase/LRE-like region domain-containing protein n=1 Tax=Wickerhamomyces pijperi TaxID=599730 RepID=A0A9P8PZ38_WICPI|nr:hypothetical protein WICPIJ_008031 [Wickerhamomyces pijperi]